MASPATVLEMLVRAETTKATERFKMNGEHMAAKAQKAAARRAKGKGKK